MIAASVPHTVCAPLRHKHVQRDFSSRIIEFACTGEDPKALQDVVMPVRRKVEAQPVFSDHSLAALGENHVVPQDKLRGLLCRASSF